MIKSMEGGNGANYVGSQFSTKDRDNDKLDSANCAEIHTGGWWFSDCGSSNLNGILIGDQGNQPDEKVAFFGDTKVGESFLTLSRP